MRFGNRNFLCSMVCEWDVKSLLTPNSSGGRAIYGGWQQIDWPGLFYNEGLNDLCNYASGWVKQPLHPNAWVDYSKVANIIHVKIGERKTAMDAETPNKAELKLNPPRRTLSSVSVQWLWGSHVDTASVTVHSIRIHIVLGAVLIATWISKATPLSTIKSCCSAPKTFRFPLLVLEQSYTHAAWPNHSVILFWHKLTIS